MTDRQLYTTTIPSGAFRSDSGGVSTQRRLTTLSGLAGNSGSVENIGSNPGDIPLRGQFRGPYAELMGAELREILDADAVDSLELFGIVTDTPDEGYYSPQSASGGRVSPQTSGAVSFDATLVKEGTRASHRRAIATDQTQIDTAFGSQTTNYVGVPATASKVEWLDRDKTQRQTATPDQTVTAEFGDVDLYDITQGPFSTGRPYLIYDLPYARAGDVDVAVFDTWGNSETDADGIFAWQPVYRSDHEFRGDLVLENGLIRVTLDESAQSITAERWDDGASSWSSVSLGASSWQLYDVDLRHPGAARVDGRLTFEDSSDGSLFVLDAALHRGWDDVQFAEPTSSTTPSGLVTLLDPIAASTINSPEAERTLIDRSDLPVV